MGLTLTIETGNAAMRTPRDMAEGLRQVIAHLEGIGDGDAFGGPIRDENGNTVGKYHGSGEWEESNEGQL